MNVATKNNALTCLMAFLMVALLCCTAAAEIVQPGEDFWYLDNADVLSQETEGEIFFANQRLYDACGGEIVVVTIDSTDGLDIDDYTYALFNDWEIGGSKYLGMVLLLAVEDDNYYAMPGTMLGAYIDSATISDYLQTYLEPDFAKKDYDAGTRKFFEAIYARVVDVLNLNLSIEDAKDDYLAFMRSEASAAAQPVQSNGSLVKREGISIGAIILIIVLLIVLLNVTRRFHRTAVRHAPPPPTGGYVRHNRQYRASSMLTGYMLGRMAGSARNRRFGAAPPMQRGFSMHREMDRNSGRPSGGNAFGGFSGAGRSSSPRTFSGFGGASRSGGSFRGPATRGGGAGRFSRK